MKKFEYKSLPLMIVNRCGEADLRRLNDLGEEGWELVSITDKEYIFKREFN